MKPVLTTGDEVICSSDLPHTLTVNEKNGKSGTIVWTRNGEVLSTTTSQLTVTESGEYKVQMVNGSCYSDERADETVATIDVQELSVAINVGANDVDEGTEVQLVANVEDAQGEVSYTWMMKEKGETIGSSNPQTYIALETDYIYAEVVDQASGCRAISNEELINVLLPVEVPNAFTPNGDGFNDTWVIDGLETYRNSSLKVFNRWGQAVYSNTGVYQNDWDGRRNGKDLPVGAYYYVITLNQDGKENISGDVTIIR